ncbi:MAG: universal stress protein [Planctomycetota bacterium]
MLVTESRPRNLKWFHAGPLLYGDWGTSRLYVLGLAFFYTAHASVIHLAAIGALMLAVAWAYSIVCRAYPDGGGVYTAAREQSPTLSVVGATLLLSGYIMTAAISVIEAFHYFGVPKELTLPLAAISIVLIGCINWLGAKSAGRFAFVIAFGALGVSAVVAIACLPFFFKGIQTISFSHSGSMTDAWVSFTKICLALAGVEAVANMTGLMNKPVEKTAKRTIWPVTIEVVVLNMLFGLALAGLPGLVDTHVPDAVTHANQAPPDEVLAYRDTAMKEIARASGEHWLGETPGFIASKVAGITFGLLLLSATNTAIMAMVSVLFAMAQDRELPKPLTKLNYSGVPWVGLIVAVLVPIGVIIVEQDVQVLAKLYVLGVCGAITTNILSCAFNKRLDLSRFSRIAMTCLGLFLLAVSLTIAITQLESLAFSGGLVMLVLGTRAGLKLAAKGAPEPIEEPATGWLAEARRTPVTLDPGKPRVMLAARGRNQSDFAVDFARSRNAILFAIFVRTIRVMDLRPGQAPKIETDAEAQQALGETAVLAREAGVPFIPIYVTSSEISEEILDHTVTYGCETLIMGKSRRSLFSRRIAGDVITQVAEDLPDNVALITRSADEVHVPRRGNR